MERLALVRFRQHLVGSPSFNSAQSAYRRPHSTEKTLLRMNDFVHRTIDRGQATMLIAFDISAAFDMVVHSSFLHRLSHRFGIDDVAIRWIKSYMSERSQFDIFGTASSNPTVFDYGVPQGSLVGPILLPFIHRRWRKLSIHMEFLYSSSMPMARSSTLLCPRYHQRMLFVWAWRE